VAHAEERLHAASASRRYVSENTKASRLYWWTAEYGLVGDVKAPRIYGAGLLSSLGEAKHCLTDAVKKVPHGLVCTETEYDITRMQPQLFVARDFEQLFEVLAAFEGGMAWKRGGDYGLEEALRARTVNHLVLGDGVELTGKVVERVACEAEVAPGLATALARLEGPVMTSREGKALSNPWPGQALVVFGEAEIPERGAFSFELKSGLFLTGFAVGGGEVVNLRGHLNGRPLDLPSWCLVHTSPSLPSVAGGPADPETWDRWFGELNAFSAGEGELQAQARKAEALAPALAELYREVRRMREAGATKAERLEAIRQTAAGFSEDWLLKAEVAELLGELAQA
jgi:phenylalanine-4-hydroxylase